MLQIKPIFEYDSSCPYCSSVLKPVSTLWTGMYTLVKTECEECHAEIIEDLKVSHSLLHEPNRIDLKKEIVFSKGLGSPPLLQSLKNQQYTNGKITKEVLKEFQDVLVLNCIDYLYGHCLLKLLNAERHLEDFPEYGLIVIVPRFLRWMVPDGVAEIWTVDIPLKHGLLCYADFNEFVHREFARFDKIYVSKAYSHHSQFNITNFTRISKHNFSQEKFRITFIWRQDRLWFNSLLSRILKKIKLLDLALVIQNWRIRRLFACLRSKIPSAQFTVVGLGEKTKFPEWIEDCRTKKFDAETEKMSCQIYADSRLVIGVHGSNMLLPSGHAGMTIDLMTEDRWRNFAQDILYQEPDPRLASFRYRYLSASNGISELVNIALSMLLHYDQFYALMIGYELL